MFLWSYLERLSLACALPDPVRADAPAWPYVSLVMVALHPDLSPILLLSDLAAGVSAEITYVDGGFSQVVGGISEAPASP